MGKRNFFSLVFMCALADSATMIEIDHEAQDYTEFQMHSNEFKQSTDTNRRNSRAYIGDIEGITPTKESIAARLNAPVTMNHIDMDKISFERNKTGIWGWRNDKTESINGYECKVYAASNVEFITKTRSEHLDDTQARVKLNLFFSIKKWHLYLYEKLRLYFYYSLKVHVQLHCKISLESLKKNVQLLIKHYSVMHHQL